MDILEEIERLSNDPIISEAMAKHATDQAELKWFRDREGHIRQILDPDVDIESSLEAMEAAVAYEDAYPRPVKL